MKLESDVFVPFNRKLVFETYRDRLPELVPHLPNVKGITVESREDGLDGDPSRIRLLNRWQAQAEVPKIAQAVIKPDALAWLDYAEWNSAQWSCDWRIETQMFTENVRCSGTNTYEEQGDGTQLRIRGELDVSLSGIRGVPRLLANRNRAVS